MLRVVRDFLRALGILKPPKYDWFRACHEKEKEVADRIGFYTEAMACDNYGRVYLHIVVIPTEIGAIKLVRSKEMVILHRSSKQEGMWQASWFDDGKVSSDTQYRDLQDAVDDVRYRGMVLHSVMFSDGSVVG